MPAEPGFRSRQELEGRGHRGRRRARSSFPRGKSLFLTGLVILLLMSAGLLALRSLAVSIKNGGDEIDTTSARPTAVATSPESTDPFRDTPAEKYPAGAAGIVIPPVTTKVGTWTPAQVLDVLNKTKQTLIAARLDPVMLQQGNPQKYLSTISVSARVPVLNSLKTGEALGYVTRLASDHTLAAPIRVKGSMSVAVGKQKELVVTADYLWVYPLDGAVELETKGPGSKLVVVHTIETYQWFAPRNIAKKDTGLRPGAGKLYTFNMDCDLAKSGKLGLQRAAPGKAQTVPDDKAYDPLTKPEDLPNTC
jgi:hypothetical protein